MERRESRVVKIEASCYMLTPLVAINKLAAECSWVMIDSRADWDVRDVALEEYGGAVTSIWVSSARGSAEMADLASEVLWGNVPPWLAASGQVQLLAVSLLQNDLVYITE